MAEDQEGIVYVLVAVIRKHISQEYHVTKNNARNVGLGW